MKVKKITTNSNTVSLTELRLIANAIDTLLCRIFNKIRYISFPNITPNTIPATMLTPAVMSISINIIFDICDFPIPKM